jgi:hypothetical protein
VRVGLADRRAFGRRAESTCRDHAVRVPLGEHLFLVVGQAGALAEVRDRLPLRPSHPSKKTEESIV